MKHYPHDLSDVIIHPLYKTKVFDCILRLLFVLLYPAAAYSESKQYSTAISKILNGNLDSYKAYRQCCASLLMSRIISCETGILFISLDILDTCCPEYPASIALAEALVNMLEDDNDKNFHYWNVWFEERNAAFEQTLFQQFVLIIRDND